MKTQRSIRILIIFAAISVSLLLFRVSSADPAPIPNISSYNNTISLPPATSTAVSITAAGSNSPIALSTDSATKIATPVSLTEDVTSASPVTGVSYDLNNKLLGTITTIPYTYDFNTKAYLNGNYTLLAKTYYLNGKTTSSSYSIVIANPYSWTQFRLAVYHSALIVVIVLIIIVLAIGYLLRGRLKSLWK